MGATAAMKQKYVIEFIYSDNQQVYSDHVILTEKEHERVKKFLESLADAGRIEINESELMIYPYEQPDFASFRALRSRWKDGTLLDWGEEEGIKL